jgi:hypothetical protein
VEHDAVEARITVGEAGGVHDVGADAPAQAASPFRETRHHRGREVARGDLNKCRQVIEVQTRARGDDQHAFPRAERNQLEGAAASSTE